MPALATLDVNIILMPDGFIWGHLQVAMAGYMREGGTIVHHGPATVKTVSRMHSAEWHATAVASNPAEGVHWASSRSGVGFP